MNFNEHSNLVGEHSFLSPSNYHWINYNDEKLVATYKKRMATLKGTLLHEFARSAILLRVKLPNSKNNSLNMFVNDAIGFGMIPEQPLYYSEHCFGTCDAISFRKKQLRIHDLKTGETKTSMHQLEVYAAIFCLEYKIDPESIDILLRIYQGSDILLHEPAPETIFRLMETIKRFDVILDEIEEV